MFDMFNILNKVKEVQEKMKVVKEGLDKITVTGESGAGIVKVQATAARRILKIDIDSSMLKPEDKDMVQDLVVAAVNKALENADIAAKEEIKKSTEGLLPNIPGFDIGNLGGLM